MLLRRNARTQSTWSNRQSHTIQGSLASEYYDVTPHNSCWTRVTVRYLPRGNATRCGRLAVLPAQGLLRAEVRERAVPHRHREAAQDPVRRGLQVPPSPALAYRIEDFQTALLHAVGASTDCHPADFLKNAALRPTGSTPKIPKNHDKNCAEGHPKTFEKTHNGTPWTPTAPQTSS